MIDLENLFRQSINWQVNEAADDAFYAYVNGERCELRMNDFPDEPLYTLTYRGQSVDFDDRPQTWTLPRAKK